MNNSNECRHGEKGKSSDGATAPPGVQARDDGLVDDARSGGAASSVARAGTVASDGGGAPLGMARPPTVLFIGDVHIKHRCVEDVLKLIGAIERVAGADDIITRVVIAGDVLDTHEIVDAQLMNRAYELVRAARRVAPVAVLVGNHDYINNQQFLTTNHWMNGMKEWRDVTIVDEPMIVDNGAFALTPYVFPGRLVEALDRTPGWRDALCVFAHQEMRGCKMGAIASTAGDDWRAEWPPIVSGHIHERQQPSANVFYPGAALKHAFGAESTTTGISVLSAFSRQTPYFSERRLAIDGVAMKRTIYADIARVVVDRSIIDAATSSAMRLSLAGSAADIRAFQLSAACDRLRANDVKVVYRATATNNAALSRQRAPRRRGLFYDVLDELVERENDASLRDDYKAILFTTS
jgi:Calcineurin-like phosphoesterase